MTILACTVANCNNNTKIIRMSAKVAESRIHEAFKSDGHRTEEQLLIKRFIAFILYTSGKLFTAPFTYKKAVPPSHYHRS